MWKFLTLWFSVSQELKVLDEKGKLPNQIAHQGKHTFWWKGNPSFPKFDSEIKAIKLNFEITGWDLQKKLCIRNSSFYSKKKTQNFSCIVSEAYLQLCETSMMELFSQKSSIIDIWLRLKYASESILILGFIIKMFFNALLIGLLIVARNQVVR